MTWNKTTLQELLAAQDNWVVEAEGDCLSISNEDGLDAFVVASEHQIIVESPLFSLDSVSDVNGLNGAILRTHQLVPLSTIGIKQIGDSEYYVAFGSLSADSKDSVVVEEIDVLFGNISDFLELFSDFLA